jgi:hypothetical protein
MSCPAGSCITQLLPGDVCAPPSQRSLLSASLGCSYCWGWLLVDTALPHVRGMSDLVLLRRGTNVCGFARQRLPVAANKKPGPTSRVAGIAPLQLRLARLSVRCKPSVRPLPLYRRDGAGESSKSLRCGRDRRGRPQRKKALAQAPAQAQARPRMPGEICLQTAVPARPRPRRISP